VVTGYGKAELPKEVPPDHVKKHSKMQIDKQYSGRRNYSCYIIIYSSKNDYTTCTIYIITVSIKGTGEIRTREMKCANPLKFTTKSTVSSGGCTNIKTTVSVYRHSHHKAEPVLQPSQLNNGNAHTLRRWSLYWLGSLYLLQSSVYNMQNKCHYKSGCL